MIRITISEFTTLSLYIETIKQNFKTVHSSNITEARIFDTDSGMLYGTAVSITKEKSQAISAFKNVIPKDIIKAFMDIADSFSQQPEGPSDLSSIDKLFMDIASTIYEVMHKSKCKDSLVLTKSFCFGCILTCVIPNIPSKMLNIFYNYYHKKAQDIISMGCARKSADIAHAKEQELAIQEKSEHGCFYISIRDIVKQNDIARKVVLEVNEFRSDVQKHDLLSLCRFITFLALELSNVIKGIGFGQPNGIWQILQCIPNTNEIINVSFSSAIKVLQDIISISKIKIKCVNKNRTKSCNMIYTCLSDIPNSFMNELNQKLTAQDKIKQYRRTPQKHHFK